VPAPKQRETRYYRGRIVANLSSSFALQPLLYLISLREHLSLDKETIFRSFQCKLKIKKTKVDVLEFCNLKIWHEK